MGAIHFVAPDENNPNFQFAIQQSDVFYPMCHAGQNRSQTIYRVLFNLTNRRQGNPHKSVKAPHGATSGFDPFTPISEKLDENNFYEHVFGNTYETMQDQAFQLAFSRRKVDRFGADFRNGDPSPLLNPSLGPEDNFEEVRQNRIQYRKYFDENYWNNPKEEGRKVFVAFHGAVIITLSRVLEVAKANKTDCKGLHIIAIPWGDPITQGTNNEAVRKAQETNPKASKVTVGAEVYKKMAEKYRKLFTTDDTP